MISYAQFAKNIVPFTLQYEGYYANVAGDKGGAKDPTEASAGYSIPAGLAGLRWTGSNRSATISLSLSSKMR